MRQEAGGLIDMKLNKHAWTIWAIALVVAIALMAIIPFARTTAWWVGAVCTVLMFALSAYAFTIAFRKDGKFESKLLGWPIFKVGYTALIVQIIVGGIIMGIAAFCPVWAAIIAELIVFAMTGIALTVKDAAREVVTQSEAKVTDNTAAWKAIRTRANAIAAETRHPDIKKLAEEIRYADPTPTSMDGEIAQMLETLSSYADAENIKKALTMLERRNAIAKMGKNNN